MKTLFDQEIMDLKQYMISLPWENPHFYEIFLSQTYYFVQHSTRLLALASACTPLNENSLHRRFAAHISEEKGHDQLALNDLKKLSGETGPTPELAETKNLYEVQYYKIQKLHSAALFGYILALEGVASLICPHFVQRVYQAHGIDSARFLKLHIEEDPDHVDKAFDEMKSLKPQVSEFAAQNLLQSFRNYRSVLEASLRESQSMKKATRELLWASPESMA